MGYKKDTLMVLVELASKSAGTLRLKTGWKLTTEKFAKKYGSNMPTTGSKNSTNAVRDDTASNGSIAQNGKNVNTQFSISEDSDGKALTDGQKKYFKDSKVRDENGNLQVMYHGTPTGDFTVFNDGTYFTANKEYADKYRGSTQEILDEDLTEKGEQTFRFVPLYFFVSICTACWCDLSVSCE